METPINPPIENTDQTPDWLPERLERARTQAITALLTELGYEDVETLKTALHEQRQSVEKLTQDHAAAVAQVEQSQAARREALLDVAFEQISRAYPFIDPQEARLLGDFSAVQLHEDGTVSGLREAIEQLAMQRPHLLRRPAVPNIEAHGGRIGGEDSTLSPQLAETVRRKFRL